ncbi:MAG: chemotaxis protein CheW [bacterium]|nr:chemotaxis protein CheW [bacterium]
MTAMEILFFKLNNKITGIFAKYLQEVVINADPVPFLPVSDIIDRLLVHKGRIFGLVDLLKFFSLPDKNGSAGEIILLKYKEIEFGVVVEKVIQRLNVAQKRITPPASKTFIPAEFVGYECKVGKRSVPIISPPKILLQKNLKDLWYDQQLFENK